MASCLQRAATALLTTSLPRSPQHMAFSSLPSIRGLGTSLLPRRTNLMKRAKSPPALSRGLAGATVASTKVEELRGAKEAVRELIGSKYCNPILVRLGWHDAGTYDKDAGEWPKAGGATGSIRFSQEMGHGANKGLAGIVALLEPIKQKYPTVSYADLFQLASVTAIELAGGPKVPMRYGRVDAPSPNDCTPDGRLPDAAPPDPAGHLRSVFYRMGLNDQEIVALSGAHTLGRSRPERSGFGKEVTKYTEKGPGAPGGQSWTVDWLKFDNSYFKDVKAQSDAELLVLPTDAVLFQDPGFRKYAEKYAEDQEAFFRDYVVAHKKLSELGAKFDPPQGISLDTLWEASPVQSGGMSDEMKERLRKEYLALGGSPEQPLPTNTFLNIILGITFLAVLAKLTGAI